MPAKGKVMDLSPFVVPKALSEHNMPDMEVIINHQKISIQPDASLVKVLCDYGITQSKGIAIAVNESVIPQKYWESTSLRQGDRLTIIKAAQGG
ncbi:sulfur carrier protein ThiS [Parapedobacter deserti]|uniref:Sulfur carrier protein ThiS n=1 Tax=Parapedobacter deserti TaxID=1912957 RepID=A0ABV7JT56_9SPHI